MYKESQTIELKKSLKQLKEGIISLASMLNKENKGSVIFGVSDDGKEIGVDINEKTKQDVVHEIQHYLKPLPNKVNLKELNIDNKRTILIVEVEGDDTPYAAYGRYYIRINDADIMMSGDQLRTFFENKEDNYLSWEKQETKYTVDDIDEDLLIDFIRTANENGRLSYVYRNAIDALTKLELLTENGHLNNAGLYLFGNNKPLLIKEANYPTDTRTEFGEIKEFRGNIFECIRESISYIQNHISYKSIINGVQREEIPEIPIRAIREIVINSFAHCSYGRKGDFNQYILFKSMIKIYNPGSIFRNINPEKFASGTIGSKLRNVLISQVLYKYGYIDAFGTGFDRTFTLCLNNGIKFNFHNDEFGFTFIFKRNKDFLDDKINNKINDKINTLDEEIISLLIENKYITVLEIADKLNKSSITIYRHVNKLVKLGKIIRIGSRKSGYWKVN